MNTQYYGYAGWRRKGSELFHKDGFEDLNELGIQELHTKKETAENWLKDHEESPSYPKALTRYQWICDLIRRLDNPGTAEDLL